MFIYIFTIYIYVNLILKHGELLHEETLLQEFYRIGEKILIKLFREYPSFESCQDYAISKEGKILIAYTSKNIRIIRHKVIISVVYKLLRAIQRLETNDRFRDSSHERGVPAVSYNFFARGSYALAAYENRDT